MWFFRFLSDKIDIRRVKLLIFYLQTLPLLVWRNHLEAWSFVAPNHLPSSSCPPWSKWDLRWIRLQIFATSYRRNPRIFSKVCRPFLCKWSSYSWFYSWIKYLVAKLLIWDVCSAWSTFSSQVFQLQAWHRTRNHRLWHARNLLWRVLLAPGKSKEPSNHGQYRQPHELSSQTLLSIFLP